MNVLFFNFRTIISNNLQVGIGFKFCLVAEFHLRQPRLLLNWEGFSEALNKTCQLAQKVILANNPTAEAGKAGRHYCAL